MDDSNDITDTAQVVVFARAIKDNFDVIEELPGLESLHSTTKGSDLFETLKNLREKNNKESGKLVIICIDVAPAMVVSKSGCRTLLEQFLGRSIFQFTPLFTKKLCV
ncbi:General transcription factor II-I repeat domain-containing protein 2 [Thelohanellus kitauei]|uniref:General transcription factor II-I repeat domain-containing protein 2 n=1 Tax=Thelohanellus kitauei TaxID=669202 RepID=A0A0C2MCC5_THEKT|nr:General transcription factor II-I repeat domain-containing protein 2 [Thelohanellus kitauei]